MWRSMKLWHVLILCYSVSWGSCLPNWQVRQPCHLLLRFHQSLQQSPPQFEQTTILLRPHFCDFRRNWTENIQKSGLVLLLVTILRLWCHWGCRAACNRHFESFHQLLADDILSVHPGPTTFSSGLCSVFFSVLLLSPVTLASKVQFHAILWVQIARIIYGIQNVVMRSSESLLSHLGAFMVLSCPPPPPATKRIPRSSGFCWKAVTMSRIVQDFRNQPNHGECCSSFLYSYDFSFPEFESNRDFTLDSTGQTTLCRTPRILKETRRSNGFDWFCTSCLGCQDLAG